MNNQEKIIELINTIEELFDYFDIDDIIMTNDYDNNFEILSDKLNKIFEDGINNEILEMISKIEKNEIFYIEQVEKFKNNKIRKQIVEYLNNLPLHLDYELVKKHIKENYKLVKYIKEKEKILELLELNEKVILLMDAKYLKEELILKQMKKSDFITEIFLGMHEKDNNLYQTSMFYRNNQEINNLLYEQSKKYLKDDNYKYIYSSKLVKNNLEITKYVLDINPKLYHYIGNNLKENKELKKYINE